ncbi:MAG: hypothetical protein ACN4E2_05615 [Nitrospinota bacterium]
MTISITILMLLTLGCASSGKKSSSYRLGLSDLDRQVSEKRRTLKIYDQMETAMILEAIVIDDELAKSYTESLKKIQGSLSNDLLLQSKPSDQFIEFLIGVYTSEPDNNDLDKRSSNWRLKLTGQTGVSFYPYSIERVRTSNLKLRDNLPFRKAFKKFYIVLFKHEGLVERPYSLEANGFLGEGKISWD